MNKFNSKFLIKKIKFYFWKKFRRRPGANLYYATGLSVKLLDPYSVETVRLNKYITFRKRILEFFKKNF